MTERETELIQNLESAMADISVSAVVDLCKEFLFPRKEFEKAELLLLERVGIQPLATSKIIDLTLGQLYIELDEIPRAKRFLTEASSSKVTEISSKAHEILETLSNSS